MRASASYIPGSHNLKIGYQGNISHPSQGYFNFTPFIQYRFNNGVPNQLNQTAVFPGTVKFQSNLNLMSFYAQDTYTRARLTLQGGVRYDGISTSYPDTAVGGPDYQLMPTQVSFPAGSTDTINWKDMTPRIGAAYDLFGNGKTAIKVNLGKYLTALTASNSDTDLQPGRRIATNTTRTWNDRTYFQRADSRRRNYIPDCDLQATGANGECGAHGQPELRQGRVHEVLRPRAHSRLGQAHVQLGDGRLRAAGADAARWPHGRLLPPLVRQLLHRQQPSDDDGRLHAVQHPDSGRIRDCRAAVAARCAGCTTWCRQWSAGRICTRSCPRTSAR